MKQKLLILLCALVATLSAMAHTFEVDGIFYYILSNTTVAVDCKGQSYQQYANEYSGDVVIPSTVNYDGTEYTVKRIYNDAFRGCSTLASVVIPETVTSIEERTFYECTGLVSVTIPNSVYRIDDSAFGYCSNLASVDIPNSVTIIGTSAFHGCTSLTQIDIPNSVTSIGNGAFQNCTNLISVTIPNSVTNLNSGTFENCTSLVEVDIPSSVNYLWRTFKGCTNLKKVTIPSSVTNISSNTFDGCISLASIDIPNSVTTIDNDAFNGCSSLTSIDIPNSVTAIGDYAFYNSSNLASVNMSTSVTKIGLKAFEGTAFYNDETNWDGNVLYIGNYLIQAKASLTGGCTIKDNTTLIAPQAFSGCTNMKSVVMPNTVTFIYDKAFENCSNLTEITIPESVTSIGYYILNKCNALTTLNFNAIECNATISYNGTMLGNVPNLVRLNIGDKVTKIPIYAFSNCSGLTSVNVPNSVTSIGNNAFYNCSNLAEVTLGNAIASIGNDAFYGTALYQDESNWTDDVLYIGNYLIKAKTSLAGDYSIKDRTQVIASSAFYNCRSLTSVVIPNTITSISPSCFSYCSSLTTVTIPNSVTSIGSYAYRMCTKLKTVTIPNSVTSIGIQAFSGCTSLTTVTVENRKPENISLESQVFYSSNNSYLTLRVPRGSKELYTAADQWKDFKKMQEFFYGVSLTDGVAYTAEEDQNGVDVEYTRTFENACWQALYLPFDINYDEWEALGDIAKLNNVHQYDTDGDEVLDKTTIEFNRVTSGTIAAHTPCVFRPKAAGEVVLSVSDRTLYGAPDEDQSIWCASTEQLYTLYGTYNVKEGLYDLGAYALSPTGSFVKAESSTQTLNPYRIYLVVTDRNGHASNAPARISVKVDGEETTSIEDIEVVMPADGIYYDLMGRPVQNPEQGIYIQNGKKVYVK